MLILKFKLGDSRFKPARKNGYLLDNVMSITRNLHNLDIAIRIVVGITLIYIAFVDTSYISNGAVSCLLGVFGIVNLLAAALRSCPIYTLAAISTYQKKWTQHS